MLLILGTADNAGAQDLVVTGRVRRVTAGDTVPVAGGAVVLHQVRQGQGGPVDSALTDRRGRYRLVSPVKDTAAIYLVSHKHDGIVYFTVPVRGSDADRDTLPTLLVYDTSSTEPLVALGQRHMVIRQAGKSGSRRVIDLVVLENIGLKTRVSPDSLNPVWRGVIPKEAIALEIGQGDISPDAIRTTADTIEVFAPISPGERQLVLSYLIPTSVTRLRLPVDQDIGRFNLLVQDMTATTTGVLVPKGVERIEDDSFLRWEGFAVQPGDSVMVTFPAEPFALTKLWWLIAAAVAVTLATALLFWYRTQQPAAVSGDLPPEILAHRIAALDEEFERMQDTASEAEIRQNRVQREELKSRLGAALANRSRRV